MNPHGIVQHPDPILRRVSRAVGRPDPAVRGLADAMARTMEASGGIGLAAIQVGVPVRLIVARLDPGGAPPTTLVDPELSWASPERVPSFEGCLSIAAPRMLVIRHARVTVRFTDLDGVRREIEAGGLAARVLQHELDHLEGRLIIDLAPAPAGAADARPAETAVPA